MKTRILCGVIAVLAFVLFLHEGAFANCTSFAISPNPTPYPVSGGPTTIDIAANSTCIWSLDIYHDQRVYISPSFGIGNGQVDLYVQANSGSARTLYVNFILDSGSQTSTLTINQEGNPQYLVLSPNDLTIPGDVTYYLGEPNIYVDLEYYWDGTGPYYAADYAELKTDSEGKLISHYGLVHLPFVGNYVITRVRNLHGGAWIDFPDATLVLRAP